MKGIATIDLKMPSFNEYVNECRRNRYAANAMKRGLQDIIAVYIRDLPEFKKPVRIHFHWIEENHRRDLDNVSYAKKFILDALVECGKLANDSQKYVIGFIDTFDIGEWTKVIVDIEEVKA